MYIIALRPSFPHEITEFPSERTTGIMRQRERKENVFAKRKGGQSCEKKKFGWDSKRKQQKGNPGRRNVKGPHIHEVNDMILSNDLKECPEWNKREDALGGRHELHTLGREECYGLIRTIGVDAGAPIHAALVA